MRTDETMDWREAIAVCVKKRFDFSGRAKPQELWPFVLGCVILAVTCRTLLGDPAGTVIDVAIAVPLSAAMVRRYHDAGMSGYHLILPLCLVALGTRTVGYFAEEPGLYSLAIAALVAWSIGISMILHGLSKPPEPRDNRWGPAVESGSDRSEKAGMETKCTRCRSTKGINGQCPMCDRATSC